MTWSHAGSRAWHQLHVFASSSDWFLVLFSSVVIGQSDYFWFGFTTLNWKPLYDGVTLLRPLGIERGYSKSPSGWESQSTGPESERQSTSYCGRYCGKFLVYSMSNTCQEEAVLIKSETIRYIFLRLQSKLSLTDTLGKQKVSATGAGRLRECATNTEFVWARVQTGFFQGGRK